MVMANEVHFASLAACLPLNERTATWARHAIDRGVPDEREFCRVLARRFHAEGLDHLLEEHAAPAVLTKTSDVGKSHSDNPVGAFASGLRESA
jgi:hypothetical protein